MVYIHFPSAPFSLRYFDETSDKQIQLPTFIVQQLHIFVEFGQVTLKYMQFAFHLV